MLNSEEKLRLFIEHIVSDHDIKEKECLEFKHNDIGTVKLGKYISALANAAVLHNKSYAYVVFGIEDESKNIIGTSFKPATAKEKGQEYESWLNQKIEPNHFFKFYSLQFQDKPIVVLEVAKAEFRPIKFNNIEYFRIGSSTRKLADLPAREIELWGMFRSMKFESTLAMENKSLEEICTLLDINTYYELLQRPMPVDPSFLIEELCNQQIIQKNAYGTLDITNLGAITLAKSLENFPNLKRKGIRLTKYNGLNKNQTTKNFEGNKGYAIGFRGLLKYIDLLLPSVEVVEGLREIKTVYPKIAIREMMANALVHQDLNISGASPTIEIFDDRIEITNPGKPVIEIDQFLRAISISRNEKLGNLMRQLRICEERGTGMVKIIQAMEAMHLPAPKISIVNGHTICTLYAYKKFENMSLDEKLEAVYAHCSLQHLSSSHMSNSSLKIRFGLADINKNTVAISKLIKKALEEGKIKVFDPKAGTRSKKYIPYWA